MDKERNSFYVNTETGESVWSLPKDDKIVDTDKDEIVVDGKEWDRFIDEDGNSFYVNKLSKRSSWTRPEQVYLLKF